MIQPARTVIINGKELPWPTGCPGFRSETPFDNGPTFFEFRISLTDSVLGMATACQAQHIPHEAILMLKGFDGWIPVNEMCADLLRSAAAVAAEWFQHQLDVYAYRREMPDDAVFNFLVQAAAEWRSQIVWPQPETKENRP